MNFSFCWNSYQTLQKYHSHVPVETNPWDLGIEMVLLRTINNSLWYIAFWIWRINTTDSSNEMPRSHPQSFFTQCRPNNLHVERVPKWYRRYWSRDGTLRTSDAGLRMGWVGRRWRRARSSRCPWPWVSDWSLCQKTCLWQMKCWLRQVFYFLSAYHKNCFLRSMGLKRILLSFL